MVESFYRWGFTPRHLSYDVFQRPSRVTIDARLVIIEKACNEARTVAKRRQIDEGSGSYNSRLSSANRAARVTERVERRGSNFSTGKRRTSLYAP
jgi:hypothetical protein